MSRPAGESSFPPGVAEVTGRTDGDERVTIRMGEDETWLVR